jgi:hypothetical protein
LKRRTASVFSPSTSSMKRSTSSYGINLFVIQLGQNW